MSLDTVLRRYFAGYALFSDFLVEEAEEAEFFTRASLKSLLRTQAAHFDRLVAAVSEEYSQETDNRLETHKERRAKRVLRLLAGEALDTSDLDYDFDAHHIAVIASDPGAAGAVRQLSGSLDCRLLLVHRDETTVWAWLGARQKLDSAKVKRLALQRWSEAQIALVIGESRQGLSGWRFTHQQARAALQVALRRSEGVVRYADVALVASMIQDDLLVNSLRALYLEPLSSGRDGGETLRKTLRAYFAAERNVSSAAAALRISRRTVANRLQAIETHLGCTITDVGAEMELALRLEAMEANAEH